MSNRYHPSRSARRGGARPNSVSRRPSNAWNDAGDRNEWGDRDEEGASEGADAADDWNEPRARQGRSSGANRRSGMGAGAPSRSRVWDDDAGDDDSDEWERPPRRSAAYQRAPNGARAGYGGSASRSSARGGAYRSGPARNGAYRAPARAAGRASAPRGNRWLDTVERWAETAGQWAVSQAQRLFTSEQRAAAFGSNGWDRARQSGAKSGAQPAAKNNRRVMLIVIFSVLLLPLLGGIQLGVVYLQAKDGLQHFKNAQTDLSGLGAHPFDANAIAQMRAEFASAASDFDSANGGIQRIPGLLGYTPLVGSKLSGAQRLVPIAAEAAQAGVIACDALSGLAPKMKNPFDTSSGAALTADDLKALSDTFARLQPIVSQILTQVAALQPSDLTLDSRLGPMVASVQTKLPEIKQVMTDLQATLALAGTLLGVGQSANYLLEVLDSTELRPGGGFIGNYGFVTVAGGHLGGIKMQDVDLLDINAKYGSQVIPIPDNYSWFNVFPRWGFRDSNLDSDFPTSAKNGEQLYKEETGSSATPVTGVIAITPWLIQSMLKITGPITMPEYNNDQISADNLVAKIHYYQLTNGVPPGSDKTYDPVSLSSLRKRFSGLLFKHFMDTVKAQSAQDMGPLMKTLVDGLRSKDLQVYLDPPPAEDILVQTHLGSTLDAPAGGDSFMAVDANIIANKSNYVVSDALSDVVTLDAKGNATHHTTLTYTWPKDPATLQQTFPSTQSKAWQLAMYQRLYVPPGATLNQRNGWYTTADTTTAFNRQVWGGKMAVNYGTTTTLTVDWTVPSVATHSASGWHYTYLLQRQAGARYTLNLKVALPSCGTPVAVPSGFTATDAHTITLAPEPFSTDTNVTLDYAGC
jgi:hypothetical protein